MNRFFAVVSLILVVSLNVFASESQVYLCKTFDGTVTRGTLMVKPHKDQLIVWAPGVSAKAAIFDFESDRKTYLAMTSYYRKRAEEQTFFLAEGGYYVRRISTSSRARDSSIWHISVEYVNASYGHWNRDFTCTAK